MPDLTFAQLWKLRTGDLIEFAGRGRVLHLSVTSRLEDVDQDSQPLLPPIERRSIRVIAASGHGPGALVECQWFAFEGHETELTVVYG